MKNERDGVFSLRDEVRPAPLAALLDCLLGLRTLDRGYRSLRPSGSPEEFLRSAFERLDVRIDVAGDDLDNVPRSGAAILVANHPYGGIEGMALALILRSVRPDVRVMANYFLGRIPELRELFLLVDPFERPGSVRRNVTATREALEWLADGGLLVIFPAGEVAHFDFGSRRVVDPPWSPTIARLARKVDAPVIPVYFEGHNGWPFQLAGMLHPILRTALLPRQLLARRSQTLSTRVGRPVPVHRLRRFTNDHEMVAYLRRRTEILSERADDLAAESPLQPRRTPPTQDEIIAPIDPELLEDEVAALAPECLLVEERGQQVYVASSAAIPNLLREIGRLREVTFRAAGEGTGRKVDLDRFDASYEHLFIWHGARREVVGAYRLRRCDEVSMDRIQSLYSSTLFRYSPELFEAMGPAVELGRSFIRIEHQKSFAGLALLWKGIGQYVLRNPRYPTLFGPVSISADYRSASQQLIASFLKQNNFAHAWSRWVRPVTPFRDQASRPARVAGSELRDLDDVSAFIAEIETDHKGVPILLKQYLKLGGRLLGFNVDPEFSNVLDVLIMVDLRATDRRILGRYMGSDAAERFLNHHRNDASEPTFARSV